MACYSHGTLPPLSLKGARWTGVNGSDPTVGALSVLYLGRKRATDDENQLVQRKASGGYHSDVHFFFEHHARKISMPPLLHSSLL